MIVKKKAPVKYGSFFLNQLKVLLRNGSLWTLTENTEIIIYQISGKFHFLKLTETFVKVLKINIKLPLKNKVIKN